MRKTVFSLLVISSLFHTTNAALRMLVQLYLKELEMQPLIISLSISSLSLGAVIGSVFFGVLSDTRAKRPLMFIILATSAVATGALALLLPAFGTLSLLFLSGVMGAGLIPIMLAIVSQGSSACNRGRNLSLITSSRSLGFLLGMFIAGFLLEKSGFSSSFLVVGTLLFIALSFLLFLPRDEISSSFRARTPSFKVFAFLVTRRSLTGLYLATILRQMGMSGAISLIFVYMTSLRISLTTMGMVSASNALLQVLGMLLFGQLADRVSRKVVFISGFCLSVLVPLFFAFTENVWGMLAGHLTLGLAFSSLYVGSTAYIGDFSPAERQGAMLGLFESSRGVGGVLGPLIAGGMTPVVGFDGMFLIMAGIAAIGLILVTYDPLRVMLKRCSI